MRKQIKKYGNSAVIVLSFEDMKVYDLKYGDVLDIEICKINKEKRNGQKQ